VLGTRPAEVDNCGLNETAAAAAPSSMGVAGGN